MEYWNDRIFGRIFALFLVILYFAIHTPQSKREATLCYGSWMAPEGEKLGSSKSKAQNSKQS